MTYAQHQKWQVGKGRRVKSQSITIHSGRNLHGKTNDINAKTFGIFENNQTSQAVRIDDTCFNVWNGEQIFIGVDIHFWSTGTDCSDDDQAAMLQQAINRRVQRKVN